MSWLLRDGDVLASLEEARGASGRTRGLLGRDGFEGALLLRPARSVHTIGMRFPIDVAYLDAELHVLAMTRMHPWRVGLPRWHARCVIEAEAGSFDRWKLAVGDELEIK